MSRFASPPTSKPRIDLGRPIELVVRAGVSNAVRCRILVTGQEITLRATVPDPVPGEVVTVIPTRQWTYARRLCCSGNLLRSRLDVDALGLEPLALRSEGDWDPADEYSFDAGERSEWDRRILARGVRPAFEMEQILPGDDPADPDTDPILLANELRDAGLPQEARALLMDLLEEDLRCLDAHAHLGNMEFTHQPRRALRHYAAGVAIGSLSLGDKFDGVLPWGLTDNRPFMRCLNGLGLCLWRTGTVGQAAAIFRRMLWLNPNDNQGGRFNLAAIEAGRTWEPDE